MCADHGLLLVNCLYISAFLPFDKCVLRFVYADVFMS